MEDFAKKIAGVLYGGAKTVAESTYNLYSPLVQQTGTELKDIGQVAAREAGAIGQITASTLTGGIIPKIITSPIDNSFASRMYQALYGTNKSISYRTVQEEYRPLLSTLGVSEKNQKILLPVLPAISFASNLIGIGGGGAIKRFAQLAAKTENATEIASLAKRELKVTDEVAQAMGEKFKSFTDPSLIEKGLSEGVVPRTLPKQTVPTSEQIVKTPLKVPSPVQVNLLKDSLKTSSFLDDSIKIGKSPELNIDRLSISPEAKSLLSEEMQVLKTQLEEKIGTMLSNKEVLQAARESSKILASSIGREQTLAWEAAMLRLRQELARQAETGVVTKEFLKNLENVKTQGTNIGRKLQSLSIEAAPASKNAMQAVVGAVLKTTDNIDQVLEAAKGVDFNDVRQAQNFYRQFIQPKTSEWIDLIRYNSMLSSPKTHLINTFSNLVNSTVTVMLTKAVRGGYDFLASNITGQSRKYFSGEAVAYMKGYAKNIQEATSRFTQVIKGQRDWTNLDFREVFQNVPLATKGAPAIFEKVLSIPTRFLEGADQFFMALVTAGEKSSIEYRAGKGILTKNPELLADEYARYFLYRSELKKQGQGYVLDAVDTLTNITAQLRKHSNPIVSYPAKFTFPFIRTPMNIFKQGIEYSPIGFATIPGSAEKMMQLTKATLGTGVAIAGGLLLASNRITWSEPTAQSEKNSFREAGMQAYSIKLGNRWYSYQKLPPVLSFPLSMFAALNQAEKEQKITEGTVDVILSSFAKYAEFYADQSYFKSMGDLWAAISGDEQAISRLIGNYPQQLVPFRALGGWLAKLTDPYQRTITSDASFVDKQVQLLMMNIPFASQNLPQRMSPSGNPVENKDRVLNALSPIQTIPQTERQAVEYELGQQAKEIASKSSQKAAQLRINAELEFKRLQAMPKAQVRIEWERLTKENPDLLKKIKSIADDDALGLTYTDRKIKSLGVENKDRATFIYNELRQLPKAEVQQKWTEYVQKKLITPQVKDQILQLMQNPPPQETSLLEKANQARFSIGKFLSPDIPTIAKLQAQGLSEEQALKKQKELANAQGLIPLGKDTYLDPLGAVGGLKRVEGKVAEATFKEFKDLSLKTLEKLNGKAQIGALVAGIGITAVAINQIPKIWGISTEKAQELGLETIQDFPFTEQARKQLEEVNFREWESSQDKTGQYRERGREVYDVARFVLGGDLATKLADSRIGQKDNPTIKFNPKMNDQIKEVISHEILHHFFDLKLKKNGSGFMESFDKQFNTLAETDDYLRGIADFVEAHYPPDVENQSNEKYSYLGQKALYNGMRAIPPQLRKFYVGVIEEENDTVDYKAPQGDNQNQEATNAEIYIQRARATLGK